MSFNQSAFVTLINYTSYYFPGIFLSIAIRRLIPWIWLRLMLEFCGAFLHESMHWIVGFLSGARPTKGTLLPKKISGGWILGSVTFSNIRWFNGLITGLAPLLIAVGFIPFVPFRWLNRGITIYDLTVWAAMALLLSASLPSRQDIYIALSSTMPLAQFLCGCMTLYIYLR